MKKIILAFSGLLALSIFLLPVTARADVNDFTIKSFVSDQTLSRNDPQGELRIVENINLIYTDYNHGILRAIPDRYKNHSLQLKVNSITSTSGAPTQYTTYGSNGNTVLKIGDPNKTITGPHQYTIDYTVRNVITFYDGYDELYWDVNGDQWQQPFEDVIVRLHLPNGVTKVNPPACFTGSFGSTNQNCGVTADSTMIAAQTTQPLSGYQTLTYVASFEKGYFQPHKWYETLGEYSRAISGILLPVLVVGGGSAVWWWRRGRDPKGRGTIIPQYEAPGHMKPLMVGGLIDFKVDNGDITAVIIDLAVRGYIKIIETKKNKLIGKDKLEYKLQLLNPDFAKLDADERELLNGLFPGGQKNAEIDITKSKAKLYKISEKLRKNVKTRLTDEGYLRGGTLSSGKIARTLFWVFFGIIMAIFLFAATKIFFIVGLALGVLIALPFWIGLQARTLKGVEAKEHILGLKIYLETAEKDRIAKLQAPDATYAAGAGMPEKTIELFERLLPYAMILGVEKQWAEQFKDLYKTPPDWYSGHTGTFNSAYLASHLGSGMGSAVNSAFSAPSSSGGSGSSGGSSGGGGGGGGGGGW